MIEMNYSKRQIKPIIEKYNIAVETDENFREIILMFNGQTNYQIWALKLFYNNICSIAVLARIRDWAIENPTEIKNLIRQNIVSYTKAEEMSGLFNEMRGLTLLKNLREGAAWFNTDQRKLLVDALTKNASGNIMNGLEAMTNISVLVEWEKLFNGVKRMAKTRKEKLISTSSALRDLSALHAHIKNALTETYEWNREDMLSYMEQNTPDCQVVFDKNNVVVLNVPSFKSSQSLCGKGRTCWCLTREDRYFRQYVTDCGAKQYFLFDFNKREDHQLAHIGFTVHKTNGITNAHSCRNDNMCGSGINVDGERVNIQMALKKCSIPLSTYISLKKMKYTWNKESVLKMIDKNRDLFAISYCNDSRIIVNILNDNGYHLLLGHSLISSNIYSGNYSGKKLYAILNFDVEWNDESACILLRYTNDRYGSVSLDRVVDAYNTIYDDKIGFLHKLGIKQSDYLGKETIDPKILLHKLINEHNETEAISLLSREADINVNYEFEANLPIFAAIEQNMFGLFEAIVNHKTYDSTTTNGYGASVFQSLLFAYDTSAAPSSNHNKNISRLLKVMLNSSNVDFNTQDINAETALSIACNIPSLLWVVEELVKKSSVNVNIVDDFNFTPLGSAINCKNLEAIKLLGTRKDLIIRACDEEHARARGFNLYDIIQPNSNSEDALIKSDMDLSEIFAQAFGCL